MEFVQAKNHLCDTCQLIHLDDVIISIQWGGWLSASFLQMHLAPYLQRPLPAVAFFVHYQQYFQRLPYLVLDVVAKHVNVSNLPAQIQISEVNPLLFHNVSDHDVYFKMLKHNPKAKHKPSGEQCLQIVLEKKSFTTK